jgi:hypothetical protein
MTTMVAGVLRRNNGQTGEGRPSGWLTHTAPPGRGQGRPGAEKTGQDAGTSTSTPSDATVQAAVCTGAPAAGTEVASNAQSTTDATIPGPRRLINWS